MIRKPIQPRNRLLLGILSITLLILGYSWLSHRQHKENAEDTTIPTWTQLKQGIHSIIEVNKRTGERWIVVDSKATGIRLFAGLALGIGGALLIGMLMGCFASIEAFFSPPLSLLAKIPPTAALAVFFVLVGTENKMYVAMIAFGILPALAQSIHLAVKEFPDELQFKTYTLGASHSEVICSILMRYVFPRLIDSVRLLIGPAMVFLIAAEMVVGDVGFGYRIRLQSKLLNMSVVYPYLAILAMFGFTVDYALKRFQSFAAPWYDGARG